MSDSKVLLVGPSLDAVQQPWIAAVLSALTRRTRATIERATIAQVLSQQGALQRCGVVWVVVEGEPDRAVDAIASTVMERQLLGAISMPGERAPAGATNDVGLIALPPDADPEVLATALRAMLSQATLVRSLRTEVHVLQLHHTGLCDQIGRIDEELRLAAQLQREFLPTKLPRINSVEFKVLFRPAGYVSGDIYDVQRLDDDHVGFFVADAVGHGVPAALMTMFIKRSLHTKIIDPTIASGYRLVRPDEALNQLNRDLIAYQSDQVRTATACYGVINTRTLELQFARAGHPFPIILRANGQEETLEPDGGILGVFPEEEYAMVTTRLNPGDRLLLYSDGFEVAFPHAGSIANDRYTEEFRDLARGPLDQALQRLVEKLDSQTGSLNQRDDLTVVCLDVQPAGVN